MTDRERAYVEAARQAYVNWSDGDVDMDAEAVVSEPDEGTGAYVQAWVWVAAEDAGLAPLIEEEA